MKTTQMIKHLSQIHLLKPNPDSIAWIEQQELSVSTRTQIEQSSYTLNNKELFPN